MSVLPSPSKSLAWIGISPLMPHGRLNQLLKLLLEVRTYQVPLLGRHTAMSGLPSPSKSPRIGRSPLMPHCRTRLKPPLDFRTYQVPLLGRHTAMSVLPSPSKSQALMGTSPVMPHSCTRGWLRSKFLLDSRTAHWPLLGRHTAMSVLPSPSKSEPMMGMSP